MAKKIQVEVETPGLEETGDKFVRLTSQIRETKRQLQAAQEAGDSVKFNELKKELDNLEDKLDVVNIKQKEFKDALSAIPGPAGKVGQAMQGLEMAFKTFIANPYVAILAGIAAVFLAMYEAMKKTAEGQKALSAVTDAFGRIITPIIKFISAVAVPVFTAFADAIDFVSAAFRDFTGSYADFQKEIENDKAMRQAEENVKRITAFLDEEGFKYDEITKKKITAKQKYYEKVVKINGDELTNEATKNKKLNNAALELNKALDDADKERAKKVSDNQKVLNDKSKAAADKAFNDKIARMGSEDKLDEAKLEKMKADQLATAKTEIDKFNIESLYADKKYALQKKNLEELKVKYKQDSKEYMDYQTQLITLDAARVTQLTSDAEKRKKLKEDEFKNQMQVDALLDSLYIGTLKKEEDREEAAFQSKRRREKVELTATETFLKSSEERKQELLAQFDEGTEVLNDERILKRKQKTLQEELEILNIRKGALLVGSTEYFNVLRQIEENAYQQKLLAAKGNKEKELALEKEHSANLKNIKKQELDQYLSYATTTLSGVSNILNMASKNMEMQQSIDIANAEGNEEKITEIKKKAFEENKKMQIAQAIIGTLQGAIQAYQSLAVIPVVGVGLGIAAAAAALVFGYKQVNLIKQQKFNAGTSGSSSGTNTTSAPTPGFNGAVNVPAPVIGGSQASPTGGLGQTIAGAINNNNSNTRPIQAYVVGGQVTTQQQLDRRISLASKMGG
jgi:hypothetical protein